MGVAFCQIVRTTPPWHTLTADRPFSRTWQVPQRPFLQSNFTRRPPRDTTFPSASPCFAITTLFPFCGNVTSTDPLGIALAFACLSATATEGLECTVRVRSGGRGRKQESRNEPSVGTHTFALPPLEIGVTGVGFAPKAKLHAEVARARNRRLLNGNHWIPHMRGHRRARQEESTRGEQREQQMHRDVGEQRTFLVKKSVCRQKGALADATCVPSDARRPPPSSTAGRRGGRKHPKAKRQPE